MNLVPEVSIRLDPRFNLEDNWKIVAENIQECQLRGVLVTPLTVFDCGEIIGWYLHGWNPLPTLVLYQSTPPEHILNYHI